MWLISLDETRCLAPRHLSGYERLLWELHICISMHRTALRALKRRCWPRALPLAALQMCKLPYICISCSGAG